jgi:hypothetical protein
MKTFAQHAYHTAIGTSKETIPYSLVYVMEEVMQLEGEILSLRVLMESELEKAN